MQKVYKSLIVSGTVNVPALHTSSSNLHTFTSRKWPGKLLPPLYCLPHTMALTQQIKPKSKAQVRMFTETGLYLNQTGVQAYDALRHPAVPIRKGQKLFLSTIYPPCHSKELSALLHFNGAQSIYFPLFSKTPYLSNIGQTFQTGRTWRERQ